MKKIIIYFAIIFAVASTSFATSATATAVPTITDIHGGYGVTATITGMKGLEWHINISGPYMIYGMETNGIISSGDGLISGSETIRTPMFPPAFGFGKICIKVSIDRIILPDIVEERCAFMIGPFVLFVNNAQCDDCD